MGVQKHRARLWWRIHVAAVLMGGLLAALMGAERAAAADKHAVLIVDSNTGQTLYQSAADAPRYPASLTKLMTLYLVFEQIEQGRLSYQTRIKMSATAVDVQPSKLDLEEGEEIAVIDAIKALITKSANDIAIALAEAISGGEAKFAVLMTRKAAQLGMPSTRFKNASGLPDEEQVTTARDMVTLALRLQDDFPRHYPLFATRSFTYKDETYRNHNKLLATYEGTDGLKTGYINASGFNLVTSVRRGKKHVIGAVFGGATGAQRDRTMRTFLNIGLVKASNIKTRGPAAPAPTLVVARPKPIPEPKIAAAPAPKIAAVPAPKPVERPAAKPAPDNIEAVLEADAAPATLVPQWTAASAGLGALRSFVPSDRPALFADLGRAALPSTLDEQAAQLRGTLPSAPDEPAAKLGGNEWVASTETVTAHAAVGAKSKPVLAEPAKSAGIAGTGGFQIQIGAYQSAAEAERRLVAVRGLAPAALRDHAAVTVQVRQGSAVLHRARFAGFDAPAAANACSELKRLKVECLVMKAE